MIRRARDAVVVALLTFGAVLAFRGALWLTGRAIRFFSGIAEPLVVLAAVVAVAGAILSTQIVAFGVKRLRTGLLPVLFALAGAVAIFLPRYRASIEPLWSYDLHGILTVSPSSENPDNGRYRPRLTYRTNRFGLRGRDIAEAKRPGTIRVALVGDSFIFGLGVPDGETLKDFLDAELRARGLGDRVEVLNLGVCGSNLPTHIRMHDVARRHFDADIVVMGLFLWNDLSTWDWQDEAGGLARVSLFSALKYLLGRDGAAALMTSLFVQHGFHALSLRVLDRLLPSLRAVREPAAPPLVVLAYNGAPEVRDRFRALPGLTWIDAPPDEKYYLPRDGHPSGEGNRAFARLVMDALAELPALRAPSPAP